MADNNVTTGVILGTANTADGGRLVGQVYSVADPSKQFWSPLITRFYPERLQIPVNPGLKDSILKGANDSKLERERQRKKNASYINRFLRGLI